MRLLEPLSGIKTAQGHALVHLIFFITMFFIPRELDFSDHRANKQEVQFLNLNGQTRSTKYQLGQYVDTHELTYMSEDTGIRQQKEKEQWCFEFLQWGHLLTFICQQFIFHMKQREWYNLTQVIQGAIVPLGYMTQLLYCIFVFKLDVHNWDGQVNYVRAWIFIEACYFFSWIFCGILFLLGAFLFKFRSVAKSEEVMKLDDNVWNDNDTDDFLRYLKFEYFMLSYFLSFASMEFLSGFAPFVDFEYINIFGVNTSDDLFLIFGMVFGLRLMHLFSISIRFVNGKSNYFEQMFIKSAENGDSENITPKKASTCETILQMLRFTIHLGIWGYSLYLYIMNDAFQNQNMVSKLWIQVELISGILDWPYLMYQLYLVVQKQHQIQYDFYRPRNPDEMILEKQKRDNLNDLTESATDKSELEVEEDFFTLTCFSYLKVNADLEKGWGLGSEKQSQLLYSCYLISIVVLSMLICMLLELNEIEDPKMTDSFVVFFVKLPCAIALHFCLYPEVAKGMNMMKFANNQSDQFVQYGSEIAYFLGFIQAFTALMAEYININLLAYQHTVEHCIIHFVALEVIMEVTNLYFESLILCKFKAIMHHPPKIIHRSSNIHFRDRTCFHKLARMFYKLMRGLYVSFIFYYVPFAVVFLQFIMQIEEGGGHGGHH